MLRHHLLFPRDSPGLSELAIRFLLTDAPTKHSITPRIEDYKQVYQYLLATNTSVDANLMEHLREVWSRSNQHTVVTKFEQDVHAHLTRLPYLRCKSNTVEPQTGLELDLVITEYRGKPVKIAVEVNGVFHFSRNAEEPLGKDVIKRGIIERRAGYKVMVIPYYEWYILEEGQKASFLRDVIEKCII